MLATLVDAKLQDASVLNRARSVWVWRNTQFPLAKWLLLVRMRCAIPTIEIAMQIQPIRTRRPLAAMDAVIRSDPHAIVTIAFGEFVKTTAMFFNIAQHAMHALITAPNLRFVRSQVPVAVEQFTNI